MLHDSMLAEFSAEMGGNPPATTTLLQAWSGGDWDAFDTFANKRRDVQRITALAGDALDRDDLLRLVALKEFSELPYPDLPAHHETRLRHVQRMFLASLYAETLAAPQDKTALAIGSMYSGLGDYVIEWAFKRGFIEGVFGECDSIMAAEARERALTEQTAVEISGRILKLWGMPEAIYGPLLSYRQSGPFGEQAAKLWLVHQYAEALLPRWKGSESKRLGRSVREKPLQVTMRRFQEKRATEVDARFFDGTLRISDVVAEIEQST